MKESQIHLTPLLRSNLKDSPCFFQNFADLLALVDRQCERLLAVDILARLHCFDRDFCMPMIWSDDRYDINILPIKHVSIVLMHVD